MNKIESKMVVELTKRIYDNINVKASAIIIIAWSVTEFTI